MGLITLVFLLAFTALYLSKSWEKKPEFVTKAVEKITANLDKVALGGAGYGVIALVLALLMSSGGGLVVRLIANLLIIVMALPFVFDQPLLSKIKEKIPAGVTEQIKKVIDLVKKQEKNIGYAGAVVSLLLFAVEF